MKYLVIERNKDLPDLRPVIFGTFDSEEDANEFCNSRITLLSSEWHSSNGVITDYLEWKVLRMASPA